MRTLRIGYSHAKGVVDTVTRAAEADTTRLLHAVRWSGMRAGPLRSVHSEGKAVRLGG